MSRPPPRLYLVGDRRAAGGVPALLDVFRQVATALAPGDLAIQVREKDLEAGALAELVRATVHAMRPFDVPVLVNDRLDVAIATGAAGVHLPGGGLAPADARRAWSGIVAVSTHSFPELERLSPADVDFAVFGPVFDTPSKRRYGLPQGVDALRIAVRTARVPVLALGGIGPSNAGLLEGSGAAGVAAISAVVAAPAPADAARALRDAAIRARREA